MKLEPNDNRLSRITTNWEGLAAAHSASGSVDRVADARNDALLRYASCVYKYILGATKDAHVAEDLAQEFALRFVRGDYKNADPSKGRFRDYLKSSLRNLVTDHFRRQPTLELSTSAADRVPDAIESNQLAELEDEFRSQWRKQTLAHAWHALKEFEASRNNSYYSVLHLRAQNPKSSSDELAAMLSASSDSPVSAEWVRQKLHRSRRKFAEMLILEVRRTLNSHDEDAIQEELAFLGLQKYMERE